MNNQNEDLERFREDVAGQKEATQKKGRAASTGLTPAQRPPGEEKAEAELLKTSGGDPFTQESD
jgi:hypothetical protein